MAIPTYDQFIDPILRYLYASKGPVSARTAHDAAATALGLTDAERQQSLPSGLQLIYKNRAGWAHDRIKRSGLSTSPRKGIWQLTKQGEDFVKSHPQPLTAAEVEKLATDNVDVRLSTIAATNDKSKQTQTTAQIPLLSPASPEERLSDALTEIRQAIMDELSETLAQVTPGYFENIVLDLLVKMGYGAVRTDLQRVGGPGDEGIDGVISLDKLGLEKVYVQAKRWKQNVGRPEIQAFYGAIAGQKASKGVFITTSAFTQQATDFARSVEKIVLVDGRRLTDLMVEFEVGISSKTIRIPRIDTDYFEE